MSKQKSQEFIGVGRRKTAVASVRLRKGTGQLLVNEKKLEEYFSSDLQRNIVVAPLEKLGFSADFDCNLRIKGGGVEAQAEAARLAIARALVVKDEDLKGALKEEGYLTRDPRKKERKKYGLAGARKRFQFSKR